MVICKKRFLKRYCISAIIRQDLVVAVFFLSQGYSTGRPRSYSKIKEIAVYYSGAVAHLKNITK